MHALQGMNIGIAGGGLLGRLLAWQLARHGSRVAVFDAAPHALARGAAGWTAAGMLSPWAELDGGDAGILRLGLRSIAAWPAVLAGLPAPVEFRREGSLLLAHAGDGGAAARSMARIAAQAPFALPPLSPDALRALEPDVHGAFDAWLLPGEAQIHAVEAMTALAQGAIERGATWLANQSVQVVEPHRIDGQAFDHVFDVRGVGGRDAMPGLRGVRGEIAWLHAPGVRLDRPLRVLHPRQRVYLVPRRGDVIVVGASEIESEDRSPISLRTLHGLLAAAQGAMPPLAEARVVHTDVNLRPALPDNRPRLEALPGLTRINGLYRHGWLLAPALVEDALAALADREAA